jgi:arginase
LKNMADVAAWARRIGDLVGRVAPADMPLLLGGDHSLSIGSLPALAARARRMGRPLFVLWIDAHPDCHTLDTSESGHLHGVPLAYALGEPGFQPHLPEVENPLPGAHVLALGIRSVDAAEAGLIARRGLAMASPADLRRRGLHGVLEPFLRQVRAANGLLHVSFDADALDPAVAPAVGTPVAGGLTFAATARIMRAVAASGTLGSLELVEVNPTLAGADRTAEAMVRLAAMAIRASRAASPGRKIAGPAARARSQAAFCAAPITGLSSPVA